MHSNKPRSKLRFSHLLGVVLFSSTTIYFWTNRAPQIELSSLSYCPITTSRSHVPTVILVADGKSSRNDNRTFWFKNEAGGKIISFLPFSYPPREMRFAQRISTDSTNHKLEHHNSEFDEGKRLCSIFSIPTSPTIKIPISWNNNKIMFGMSTLPDRVLNNLLVWQHWLPTLVNTSPPSPIDSTTTLKNDLPLVLVLSPPPNPTEAARLREALEEAQSLGMHVKIRPFEASRFETRYFALVKEMWSEAQIREKATGIVTEWFVFA